MNLYEFEGKKIFQKYEINIPKGIIVRREDDYILAYKKLKTKDVVLKVQVLSGKRGKNKGILFASTDREVENGCKKLFDLKSLNQYVFAILIEENINIQEEQYLSITYDTNKKQPVLVYSKKGGVDIEDVHDQFIERHYLDVREEKINYSIPCAQGLWDCFLQEDARIVEINPLIITTDGHYIAADAKVALDDDAFYRHSSWNEFSARTMMGRLPTEREKAVIEIDKGESYYRGTAGKYIEMDGDIAVLFSGGGASIANMDALIKVGLQPANYTEYSGNPPKEKVYELTKIVLSKPDLKGLWVAGGVANFTDIASTFQGIIDVLDELKPKYPIVIRRSGPNEDTAFEAMKACALRNNLRLQMFGKEITMSESAVILADMINNK